MTIQTVLYFTRHARVLAEPGICYGAGDLPACADDTGRAAGELVQLLERHAVNPQLLRVYGSPLQRCRQLLRAWQLVYCVQPAGALAAVTYEPGLREMDFGAWEGQTWDAIGRKAIDDWTQDFAGGRAGGSGECVIGVLLRVALAYQRTQQQCRRHGQHALWCSHAGVYRALLWLLADARRLPVYVALAEQYSRSGCGGYRGYTGYTDKNAGTDSDSSTWRQHVLSQLQQHGAAVLPVAADWPQQVLPVGSSTQLPL